MLSSLRLQLLAWLLVPLGFLVAFNTWLSFRDASATATAVQDGMLLGALRSIAEQRYSGAGERHVKVRRAALELSDSASRDRVYYRVVSPRGALLLGYPELASPAQSLSSEEFTHFDATMRGEPVRVAAFAHPLIGAPEPQVVLIEVAQTLRSHRELASQIWEQAIVHQLIMLALAIVLMWLGLRFGLRPLIRLRDAVLERRPGALEPLDPGPVPQELAPLVTAVNEYVRRPDEHMAAHGRLVAHASPPLRTPLSLLQTHVSFAPRRPGSRGGIAGYRGASGTAAGGFPGGGAGACSGVSPACMTTVPAARGWACRSCGRSPPPAGRAFNCPTRRAAQDWWCRWCSPSARPLRPWAAARRARQPRTRR